MEVPKDPQSWSSFLCMLPSICWVKWEITTTDLRKIWSIQSVCQAPSSGLGCWCLIHYWDNCCIYDIDWYWYFACLKLGGPMSHGSSFSHWKNCHFGDVPISGKPKLLRGLEMICRNGGDISSWLSFPNSSQYPSEWKLFVVPKPIVSLRTTSPYCIVILPT